MSDVTISLVPVRSAYPNRQAKAAELLHWLLIEEIIRPVQQLGNEPDNEPGSRAGMIVNSPAFIPTYCEPNGLEVITQRTVFSSELESLICPTCQQDIATDEWDLTPWYKQQSEGMSCPRCGQEADVQYYTFTPAWGFSDLGLTFWNWPSFKPQFVAQVAQKLGCAVRVVYQRI